MQYKPSRLLVSTKLHHLIAVHHKDNTKLQYGCYFIAIERYMETINQL